MAINAIGNMTFGVNVSEDIASTPMGVAVRAGEKWRVYDIIKKQVIDIDNPTIDNKPTFVIPSVKLREGDLIKYNEDYYFVIGAGLGITRVQCARTEETKTEPITENFLGTNCYFKIVTFEDIIEMDAASSHEEKLAEMPSDNVQTLLEIRKNVFTEMNRGDVEPPKIKWITD